MIWLWVLFLGKGVFGTEGFLVTFFFLLFGAGGGVGLLGGVGGGVRCRLCLCTCGSGCMTGWGAGVLIVWNGCFGC